MPYTRKGQGSTKPARNMQSRRINMLKRDHRLGMSEKGERLLRKIHMIDIKLFQRLMKTPYPL